MRAIKAFVNDDPDLIIILGILATITGIAIVCFN